MESEVRRLRRRHKREMTGDVSAEECEDRRLRVDHFGFCELPNLTALQKDILDMLVEGRNTSEIGKLRGTSRQAVWAQVKKIRRKFAEHLQSCNDGVAD
jgi:DNA-binding NarL/FixJ family response regulator